MYQQANNHWLQKLAHGRELYLIPAGDIAAVVFTTELLTQLRNGGIDLDRVSHVRARQDGKLLGKTANTKYAAQQIAELIQSWLPARTTDPDSQHEITQLRNQLAELRQRAGEDPGDNAAPPRPGQSGPSPTPTPIQRALMNNSSTPAPPSFDPASLLTVPTTNPWLTDHMPTTLWRPEPSQNGAQIFLSRKQSTLSSLPTLLKLRHGGHANLPKLSRLWNEWQS